MVRSLLFTLLICSSYISSGQTDSNRGHTEHFIVGTVIGAGTSYFVFKKTNNKVKSWLLGAGAALSVGLAKELIDPSIGRTRSGQDLGYTALGGVIGACIVIPLNKKQQKEISYLY